ncbi:hypothetical protein LFREDSHE_34200 [Shewanella baltica]
MQSEVCRDIAVFGGFIKEVDSIDSVLAQELLEQCTQHPKLRQALVNLHPCGKFTETDLDRCIAILDDPEIHPSMFEPILWRDDYAHLPKGRIINLAQRLLSKPNGDDVVLEALSMRLDGTVDTLGPDFRQIGLRAAILSLSKNHDDYSGGRDYRMERVISAALRFNCNEAAKQEWLDTIFTVVDDNYGYIYSCENTIASTAALMPAAFLNRVFEGTEEQQHLRQFFILHSGLDQSILAKIDVDVLIEWCRARNDTKVWAIVAAGISLWEQDGNQGAVIMSESALRLLEASPEPEAVLEAFAERVTPSSWSGSRVSAMQPRADAIRGLLEHGNPNIAMAAKSVSAKLVEWIEYEKLREQRDDEEREQRFE